MSVETTNLKPYKSLIFAQLGDGVPEGEVITQAIEDFKKELDFENEPNLQIDTDPGSITVSVSTEASPEPDQIHVRFLHYEERRQPGWYDGEELEDVLNHLVVICQRKRHVAIYLSDSSKRNVILRLINRGGGQGLGALELIAPGIMNAAFVTGPTRTLWLSGIHPRMSAKADSKILSGIDLRDALDPLGDQTYYFTAARSSVRLFGLPIGTSPRGSRIWAGATANWKEFIKTVARLLQHLEATTKPIPDPLPVVAVPSAKVPALSEAFELLILPPELLAEDPQLDREEREMMERWAYRANFEVEESSEDCLRAVVDLEGERVGILELVFDMSDPQNIKVKSAKVVEPKASKEDVKQLENIARKSRWIKVWYESGHTLTDGAIFEIRHRDQPFDRFRWADFSDYEVTKEKFWAGKFPEDAVEQIGDGNSLFDWVKKHWSGLNGTSTAASGWLACDDGAMEIADFIHLDDQRGIPVLSLIHVKGAKSSKKKRGISVASYEVVTGQAVKNLRFLDRLNLGEGLQAGLDKKIGKLVWYNGEPSTRKDMLDVIGQIGTSYQRTAVVLQPHVMQTTLKAVRQNPKHKDTGRLRQLDTLLLGAQASCRNLGAEFFVLADGA